jgi:hypothetical protein
LAQIFGEMTIQDKLLYHTRGFTFTISNAYTIVARSDSTQVRLHLAHKYWTKEKICGGDILQVRGVNYKCKKVCCTGPRDFYVAKTASINSWSYPRQTRACAIKLFIMVIFETEAVFDISLPVANIINFLRP